MAEIKNENSDTSKIIKTDLLRGDMSFQKFVSSLNLDVSDKLQTSEEQSLERKISASKIVEE